VAVHDDDLGRACRLRAPYRRVDLLRVELAPFVVGDVAGRAVRLLPLDDAGDALHIADDEDLHACVT
jgi:hypothetical protein